MAGGMNRMDNSMASRKRPKRPAHGQSDYDKHSYGRGAGNKEVAHRVPGHSASATVGLPSPDKSVRMQHTPKCRKY